MGKFPLHPLMPAFQVARLILSGLSILGITRQIVINLLKQFPQISIAERRISLVEFHTADEVFTTGTMGELTPVVEIDGRTIGDGNRPITRLIQEQFKLLTETEGVIIPGCF